MFRKTNPSPATGKPAAAPTRRDAIPSIITKDINLLGNLVSEGAVDFDGMLNGNIRCATLTLRANGCVNGEVTAETVFIYGRVKGLIRARTVQLYARCHVEGIIMHEVIAIEDGAYVDGKFKRTDRTQTIEEASEDEDSGELRILENIRLIS